MTLANAESLTSRDGQALGIVGRSGELVDCIDSAISNNCQDKIGTKPLLSAASLPQTAGQTGASMLDKALALGALGYRVFPIIEDGKTPAIKAWNVRASYDPEKIRAMWTTHDSLCGVDRERAFNIGIACGRHRNGFFFVFDVDIKEGARGRESLENLDMLATADDWLLTKRVETWSGGDHFYFQCEGPLANTASKLGPGLDTRGEGGYVVAEGSIVNGKPYVSRGGSVQPTPPWLEEMIGVAPTRGDTNDNAVCILDTGPAIDRAGQYLDDDAEVAIEGNGGNHQTFRVASRVKDYGLSQQGCCELMYSKWNERCEPPWGWEELSVIVANAYRYGQNAIGVLTAAADFEPATEEEMTIPGNSSKTGPKKPGPKARKPVAGFDYAVSVSALMGMTFPDVRWVVDSLIPEGLTIFCGAPKVGKSWAAAEMATEVGAGGMHFGKYACGQGAVLFLALEDNLRRMQSRLRKMNASISENVTIRNAWKRLNEGGVEDIATWIDQNPDARLVIIDTLAKVKPRGRLGANGYDTDSDALAPLQRLALERRIAIVVLHHDRKAKDDDWLNTISGTHGLTGIADTLALLTRVRGAGQHVAKLNVTGRDVEESEIGLTFSPISGRWREADKEVDDFDVSPEQKGILNCLREAGAAGLALRAIVEGVGKSAPNVSRMLRSLESDGAVRSPSRGQWVAVNPSP